MQNLLYTEVCRINEKYEDVYYQVMKHQLEEGIEIRRQQGIALGKRKG